MEYIGRVQNGVIVLEGEPPLEDGTIVRVEPVERPRQASAAGKLSEMLLGFAGQAKDLPPDIAENHDHYLHGLPKK